MDELIRVHNGEAQTTSRAVAEIFGKQHKDVLRAIQNLDCSAEFNQRNFAPISYTDPGGRTYIEYCMNRDGFAFLAMGFTGKEAARFKEMFIEAFNTMEAKMVKPPAPLSTLDVLELSIRQMREQEQRIGAVETAIKEVEAKISTIDTSYYAISGWASLHGRSVTLQESQEIARKCRRLSNDIGIPIGKVYDAKYGTVNTYSKDVLRQVTGY